MHPRLSSQSLAEQVANILAAQIGDGRWSTGAKLPGEVALCEEFGVSRATVREAIRDLKTKGLVSTRQGAGVFVTSDRPLGQWDRVLAAAEIDAMVEIRRLLEVQAAGLAAERRNRSDVAAIRRALVARAKAESAGDDIEYVDADLEFHRAVVAAVHNPLLDELFDSFSVRMREAMLALLAGSAERPHDQEHHQWLFDAIVDGSTRRAVELATDQLQHVRMR